MSLAPDSQSVTTLFRWARYSAWLLLGAGFLLLVANAAWGLRWGPVAVGLLFAGYCTGVVAVLPIVGRTTRALFAALTARFPVVIALGVVALLVGAAWLVVWTWVTSPW